MMNWQAWLTGIVIVAAFLAMARDLVPPAVAIMGGVITLLVGGVITPDQALQGFSNPAPVAVAALYVIARAVEKTGVLQPVVSAMLGRNGNERASLLRLLLPTASASAFLNNTPIVAMLVPQVSNWARGNGRSPSRYLMPLSFAAILGGMVTLIGTSTNLVVSGLLEQHGYPALGMFEITRFGLPIALACLLMLVVLGPVLVPDRKDARADAVESERDFVVGMRVSRDGPIAGRTVEQAGLRNLQGLYLAELTRSDGRVIPVTPDTTLLALDTLTFVGRVDTVVEVQNIRGLESAESSHFLDTASPQHAFFEAVIGPGSRLNGKTLKEANFRSTYHAAAVAIHRAGSRLKEQLGQVRLRAGDTLLLLADRDFRDRWRDRSDFLLVAQMGGATPGVSKKAWLAVAITAGVIVIAGLGIAPIVTMALLGALLTVLVGILTPGEARSAVDAGVVVAIAGAFGLAAAIETSGIAALLGHFFGHTVGAIGPQAALVGVTLVTVLMSGVITNNATAALMFPVALSTAADLNADPRHFAIMIAIAASTSFLTPVAYQTNLMVYGPGGYRFSDYARVGIPLTIVVLVMIGVGL